VTKVPEKLQHKENVDVHRKNLRRTGLKFFLGAFCHSPKGSEAGGLQEKFSAARGKRGLGGR